MWSHREQAKLINYRNERNNRLFNDYSSVNWTNEKSDYNKQLITLTMATLNGLHLFFCTTGFSFQTLPLPSINWKSLKHDSLRINYFIWSNKNRNILTIFKNISVLRFRLRITWKLYWNFGILCTVTTDWK